MTFIIPRYKQKPGPIQHHFILEEIHFVRPVILEHCLEWM